MPLLRQAYNEIEAAREAIDKQVSMIGGNDPRLTGGALSQAEDAKLSRHLASLGIRQWTSQTARDALVCGNGYLATAAGSSPSLYALRPEDVEIENDNYLVRGEAVTDPVAHIRGIDQFGSRYGISLLEPFLAEYRTRRTFSEAASFAQRVVREYPADSDEYRWAESTIELAARSFEASDERLRALLRFPREWLNTAREGLYFPGQELM
jgi:hypothetical protein